MGEARRKGVRARIKAEIETLRGRGSLVPLNLTLTIDVPFGSLLAMRAGDPTTRMRIVNDLEQWVSEGMGGSLRPILERELEKALQAVRWQGIMQESMRREAEAAEEARDDGSTGRAPDEVQPADEAEAPRPGADPA